MTQAHTERARALPTLKAHSGYLSNGCFKFKKIKSSSDWFRHDGKSDRIPPGWKPPRRDLPGLVADSRKKRKLDRRVNGVASEPAWGVALQLAVTPQAPKRRLLGHTMGPEK